MVLKVLERHPHAQSLLAPVLGPGGTPSHAYLLHGPGGAGKRSLASEFAAALLAEDAPDPASARARALAGVHPDLTWVTASGAHEILVSDIDQPVVAAAAKTPFESARRVFVIEGADRLGEDAANRLLKTLEEPPAFVHLILTTDRLGDVLETVRSRCQLVRLEGPSADELVAQLLADGVAQETAAACVRLGFGDARRARTLASGMGTRLRAGAELLARAAFGATRQAEGVGSSSEELLAAARVCGEAASAELERAGVAARELLPSRERKRAESDWGERVKRGRRRAEAAALELGFDLVEAWLLDLVALAYGASGLVRNRDRSVELGVDAASGCGRNAYALRRAVELVEDTRTRLRLNVSEELALEALAHRLEWTLAGR